METVQLGSIDIGGGIVATTARFSEAGPIVLVTTHATTGREQNSRLDMQKGMFIDPLPGTRKLEGINLLVSRVMGRFKAA